MERVISRATVEADFLQEAITAVGATARAFAGMIGSHERTVRRWLAGEREIPGPVLALCRLLIERPSLIRFLRLPVR